VIQHFDKAGIDPEALLEVEIKAIDGMLMVGDQLGHKYVYLELEGVWQFQTDSGNQESVSDAIRNHCIEMLEKMEMIAPVKTDNPKHTHRFTSLGINFSQAGGVRGFMERKAIENQRSKTERRLNLVVAIGSIITAISTAGLLIYTLIK